MILHSNPLHSPPPRLAAFGIIEGFTELMVSDFFITSPLLQKYISAALYNISTVSECHLALVNKDGVQLLYKLAKEAEDEEVKMMCALAVCHLSCGHVNSAKIVGQGGTR